MKSSSDKFQGGYIGLLSLLIALAIMGFMAVKIYEKTNGGQASGGKQTGLEGDPRGKGSIEKAQDVKSVLELQSRQAAEVEAQ